MEAESKIIHGLTLSQKREHYEKLAAVDIPDSSDITEKMFMARNVVLTHNESMALKTKSRASNVNKTMQFTGASEKTVQSALDTTRNNVIFCEVEYSRQLPARDILSLHNIITDLYVERRVIPTIKQIIECVQDQELYRQDSRILLRDLKCLGYAWKRLPGTDASVLVGNSEQLYNRINYLRKIIQYRRDRRCLVYVRYTRKRPEPETVSYTKDAYALRPARRFNSRAFAASPSSGLLNWTNYHNNPHLDHWFWCVLLPLLPKSCVVVIDSKEIVGSNMFKVPTASSTKAEMIKWLEAEDIPHNPSWHRAELYKLVETFKLNNGQNLEALQQHYSKTFAHDFLIATDLWPSLKYFTDIMEVKMSSMQPEEWMQHDAKLAQREVKIYQDSIKYEKIIDQLFTMATYEDVREMSENLEKYMSKDTEEYVSNIILE